MTDFQKRVIEEHAELNVRLEKLCAFIDSSPRFRTLHPEDQNLLTDQCSAMKSYREILQWRIERFHA